MKKTGTLVLLIILNFSSLIFAQTDERPIEDDKLSDINVNDYNVDFYSGVNRTNINIFEINEGNYKLPISLVYNSKGIKVSDEATSVGLGWSLSAISYIQRQVRGLPDDININAKKGFINIGSFAENYDPNDNSFVNYDQIFRRFEHAPHGQINFQSLVRYDCEPDIYNYNINGKTGSFFLDNDGTIKIVPYDNIKINYILGHKTTQPTNDYIDKFVIIDEDGVSYEFSEKDVISGSITPCKFTNTVGGASFLCTSPPGPLRNNPTTDKWYIKTIILPNKKEINFEYEVQKNDLNGKYTNIEGRNLPSSLNTGINSEDWEYGPQFHCTGYFGAKIYTKEIMKISSTNYQIDFERLTPRLDLLNDGSCKSVDNIIVSTKSIENPSIIVPIKKYNLLYSYFDNNPYPYNKCYDGDETTITYYQNHIYKRLKLVSLNEKSVNPSNSQLFTTTFEYYENDKLPPKTSVEQDFWGYYNANNSTTIFPKMYIYPNETGNDKATLYPLTTFIGTQHELIGADRNPNPNVIYTAMLKKIKNPQGGSTTFEYESNDFIYKNQVHLGEGVRIKKIIINDGISNVNDQISTFEYKNDNGISSGVLYDLPVFGYMLNMWYRTNGTSYIPTNISPTSFDYWKYFYARIKDYKTSSSSLLNQSFGYSKVSVIKNNGKVNYYFSTPGKESQNGDLVDVNCSTQVEGICNGLFERPQSKLLPPFIGGWSTFNNNMLSLSSYNSTNMDFSKDNFPFAPSLNYDWSRGLLTEVNIYNSNGLIERKIVNKYSLFNKTPSNCYSIGMAVSNLYTDYCYAMKNHITPIIGGNPSVAECDDLITNYSLSVETCYGTAFSVAKYKLIGDVKMNLSEIETYDYNQNGAIKNVTKYYREVASHNYVTKIENELSNNNKKIITYKYPNDYLNVSNFTTDKFTKAIKFLKISNIVKYPIEQIEVLQKAGTDYTISGQINEYNIESLPDGSENLVFKRKWSTKTNQPLTNFIASYVDLSHNFIKDSRYTIDIESHKFNNFTLPTEISTNSSLLKAVKLYDNGSENIICEAINCELEDVAYTSFEEKTPIPPSNAGFEEGNWIFTYISNLVNTDGVTGNKCLQNNAFHIVSKYYLQPQKVYKISLWTKNGQPTVTLGFNGSSISMQQKTELTTNGWNYYEGQISGSSNKVFVNSTGLIDEVRLYPIDSRLKSYTYKKGIGVMTSCDESNLINYYEYDDFGKLKLLKNHFGQIISKQEYSILGND